MKSASGKAKFDGIKLVEFIFQNDSLEAGAAFINSKTKSTHGKTICTNWPKPVLKKLAELTDLMEEHLLRVHFDGEALEEQESTFYGKPTGIASGEHVELEGDETPQV